jgi:hypothetical protein
MAYHLGEAPARDDEPGMDQAVEESCRGVESFPFFFVHALFAFCGRKLVCVGSAASKALNRNTSHSHWTWLVQRCQPNTSLVISATRRVDSTRNDFKRHTIRACS